jgi:predicted transcriptional regulator
MKSAKQRAIKLIEKLPDDVSTETIMTELLLVKTIDERLEAVERGETVSHEEARKRLAKWLEK